jgi:glycosyltransferase involved in cell wall biosynthesis
MTEVVLLSVVMPCLNEEKSVMICIRKALESFKKMGICGEVVIVDNGSTDQSAELAAQAGARVIKHEVQGYGAALRRGIHEARGKYIIMGDADNTYDYSDLEKFVQLLDQGADLVMGSRLRGKIQPGAMPFSHRWIGTPVLTFALNRFFGSSISDANCGMRGLRKDAIEKLNLESDGMEFASEMVIRAAQRKIRIEETPIDYYPSPPDRIPHLNSFRDGWRHLRFMLIWCPKYVFFIPGLFLLLAGIAMTVLSLMGVIEIFGIRIGISSAMFSCALTLVGVQVFMFGIAAAILNHNMGWTEPDRLSRWFEKYFTLERGLIGGLIFFLTGLVLDLIAIVMLFQRYSTISDIDISLTRLAVISVFLTLFGIQVMFGAFYIGMLDTGKTLRASNKMNFYVLPILAKIPGRTRRYDHGKANFR